MGCFGSSQGTQLNLPASRLFSATLIWTSLCTDLRLQATFPSTQAGSKLQNNSGLCPLPAHRRVPRLETVFISGCGPSAVRHSQSVPSCMSLKTNDVPSVPSLPPLPGTLGTAPTAPDALNPHLLATSVKAEHVFQVTVLRSQSERRICHSIYRSKLNML